MSTFTSNFKELPTRQQMQALFGEAIQDPAAGALAEGNTFEEQYLRSMYRCVQEGHAKASRPGQYTMMLDDVFMSIDISGMHVPQLTTRFSSLRIALVEMLWFISGSTDVRFLKANNVNIWDEWVIPETAKFTKVEEYNAGEMLNWVRCRVGADAYKAWRDYQAANNIARPSVEEVQAWWGTYTNETIIPMTKMVSGSIGDGAYGYQWRKRTSREIVPAVKAFEWAKKNPDYKAEIAQGDPAQDPKTSVIVYRKDYDQLADVIKALRNGADSRRIIIDAWDPAKVKDCVLPPCHPWVQFISHVNEDTKERELTVALTMRSSDAALGAPTNIAEYAILGHIVAAFTGHKATKLTFRPNDFHIYEDQLPFMREQLTRDIKRDVRATLNILEPLTDIDNLDLSMFKFEGYDKAVTHPPVKYPVAV